MTKAVILIIFALAFLERVFFDLGPNIEMITAFTVFASIYLTVSRGFLASFMLIALTDLILGQSGIFLFTWSGFLIPYIALSFILKNTKQKKAGRKLILAAGSSIGANLFFFFWTNSAVWLMDFANMYPKTASGLLQSLIAGIPFLKNQIISSLVFTPAFIVFYEISILLSRIYQKARISLFTRKNYSVAYPK